MTGYEAAAALAAVAALAFTMRLPTIIRYHAGERPCLRCGGTGSVKTTVAAEPSRYQVVVGDGAVSFGAPDEVTCQLCGGLGWRRVFSRDPSVAALNRAANLRLQILSGACDMRCEKLSAALGEQQYPCPCLKCREEAAWRDYVAALSEPKE